MNQSYATPLVARVVAFSAVLAGCQVVSGVDDLEVQECSSVPAETKGTWSDCESRTATPANVETCHDYCALQGSCCVGGCEQAASSLGTLYAPDFESCVNEPMTTTQAVVLFECAFPVHTELTSNVYFRCCCAQ